MCVSVLAQYSTYICVFVLVCLISVFIYKHPGSSWGSAYEENKTKKDLL